MKSVLKLVSKILLFFLNIAVGIGVAIYLVLKFRAKLKNKNPKNTKQIPLLAEEEKPKKSVDVLSSRLEEVYKVIKSSTEVEMSHLLDKIKGVTERTLRRDLAKLQKMKLIRKEGSTKSAKYRIVKH